MFINIRVLRLRSTDWKSSLTLVLILETNEFQNRVFLFSNFLGAAILNNCDVSWLLYCSDTKRFCLTTKGQPFASQLFKKAAPLGLDERNRRVERTLAQASTCIWTAP